MTEAPHPGDFDFCERCGRPFNDPDWDGNTWKQHQRLFMYCEDCGDEMEERDDRRAGTADRSGGGWPL